MIGCPQFERMKVVDRLHLSSRLEELCERDSEDLLGYSILVGKLLGLLKETDSDPGIFEAIVEMKTLKVPDSELCPKIHRSMLDRMARKAACKAEKVYSQRHRCPQCKDPMRFEHENLVARCADEPTKVQLMCDRCGVKQTF